MIHQKKHIRVSKKGKPFVAGSKIDSVPESVKREIVKAQMIAYQDELKKHNKVKLPELGILKIKVRKARPARMGMNPFTGEKQKLKAKPASKVVRFHAIKSLKEKLN